MSADDNNINVPDACANCGRGEDSTDSLKACTACKLVKYCNRECQIAHRPQHKKACKKRAKELYDEKLFKLPPSLYGDCPICFLRMPSLNTGRRYQSCCGKVICSGCIHAPVYDDLGNEVDNKKCPFCRTPDPGTKEEIVKRVNKRMDVRDAYAIYQKGSFYSNGSYGFAQDYEKALDFWHRAGELGSVESSYNIGNAYHNGLMCVEVDEKRARHYWELAAIGGITEARHNLGAVEFYAGNATRAMKHYMIAVSGGGKDSLDTIRKMVTNADATKDDYAKALRLYQAYLDEIKSDQRDKAAAAREDYKYIE